MLEYKQFFTLKKVLVFLLILLIALYFTQEGINKYKKIVEDKVRFQELERVNIEKFINYTQYGAYGFRLLFVPSPAGVFFKTSGLIPQMTAFIDSGVRLRVYNPLLGEQAFIERSHIFDDFSGFILLIMAVVFIYSGYKALRNHEYVKSIASICGHTQTFFFYLSAKILALISLLFILIGSSLFLSHLNQIRLTHTDYLNLMMFGLTALIAAIFFFLTGAIAGTFRTLFWGYFLIGMVLAASLLFIPAAVTKFNANSARTISSMDKLELQKLEILMQFEKKAYDEAQRYTNMKERATSERKLIEGYWKNEFRDIVSLEKKLKEEMMRNVIAYRWISACYPTTFYRSVGSEISSLGYENFFNFYDFAVNCQEKFERYYFKKKFYSYYATVEPFLKGDANIYKAQGTLPRNFGWGLLINLFYLVTLSGLAFVRSKKTIFRTDPIPNLHPVNKTIVLFTGSYTVFQTKHHHFQDTFYTLFSGNAHRIERKDTFPTIYIDEENIMEKPSMRKMNFLYACSPEHLPPDAKTKDLFRFFSILSKNRSRRASATPSHPMHDVYHTLNIQAFGDKRIQDLSRKEKALLLIAVSRLEKYNLYLFSNTVSGLSRENTFQFKDFIHELAQSGSLVIYLAHDITPDENEEFEHSCCMDHTLIWNGMVDSKRP